MEYSNNANGARKNKAIWLWIILLGAILIIIGWLWYIGWLIPSNQYSSYNNNEPTSPQSGQKGTLLLSVTDAAANMGSVSDVAMTVDQASVLNAKTQEWVNVSTAPQTFHLLNLNASGRAMLLGRASVPAGEYQQVWLHISKVEVTDKGKVQDAVMASNDFKMSGKIIVNNGESSYIKMDVIASQSLHTASNGQFVFLPVVNMKSESNASVNVNSDKNVMLLAGNLDSDVSAGTDVNGQVKDNFNLGSDAKLSVGEGSQGIINLDSNSSSSTGLNISY